MKEFAARDRRFPLDRVHLMGIVNANDDSFCGDGSLDQDRLLAQARRLVAEGADILDVGGESARTNRGPVSEEEEIRRIAPLIRALRAESPDTPVSINTWRPAVAEAGLEAGAAILNDMSGLPAETNARIAAKHGAGLVLMHLRGEPKQAQTHACYEDVVAEVADFFRNRIALATQCGLDEASLLLDPGLDFAKQRDDNLRLLANLRELANLGLGLLIADSRKTFIGEILDRPPLERDWGTLAASLWAMENGGRFFRVHNVAAHRDAAKVWQAVVDSRGEAAKAKRI